MTPQELKNSILQLAVQGKLVEQRAEEGTAESVFLALFRKKEVLLKEKVIYKKNDTKPFYTEEDLANFEIPSTWKWVQLSDVSFIQEGAGIRKWQYKDKGTQILCVTNILNGNIDLDKKQLYISDEEYREKYVHLTLNKGDIVTACSGGSWGKVAIFDKNVCMMLNTSTLRMRFFGDLSDNGYLYYICQSEFFKKQLKGQLSGMQPNFGYAHYSRIMIPLPPLEEQKRIVAKIEELLPQIDRYEKAWSKLEEFNKRFPDDMQKSILQYAVQGKLVEQRAEEGTAEELYKKIQAEKQKLIAEKKIKKEKPLPEITAEEIPFDIPESWKWVRLGEIADCKLGKTINKTKDKGILKPYLCSINVYWDKIDLSTVKSTLFTEAEIEKYSLRKGDLLVCEGGDVGRSYIWEFDTSMYYQNALHRIRTYSDISPYFLKIIIEYYKKIKLIDKVSKGVTIKHLVQSELEKLFIPLPPLEEQKRIIAKIEELLPLCEKLKK